MKNYYKILEVDPMASHEEIRDAYRKAVKKYHPDVSQVSNSEAMIREINEAYEILSDETSRQQYDNELKYTLTGGQAPTKQRASEGSYKKKGKRSRRDLGRRRRFLNGLSFPDCIPHLRDRAAHDGCDGL